MSEPPTNAAARDSYPPLLHFDGLVPLVVGVAGHRDPVPAELPRIREDVERALVTVLALGGRDDRDTARRETPIVVVSSLAEGADRLVARVVLDARAGEPAALTAGRARMHLAAILPMEEAEYERTFDGTGCESVAASVAEYRALVGRARQRALLPPPSPGSPEAAGPKTTTLAFERMAAFLAWHSHVMIALWNGQSGAPGGTTDSVQWFTGTATPSFAPCDDCIDAPDGLVLLRVHTPRASPDRRPMDPREVEGRLDPQRATKVLRQIEGFNRDVVDHGLRTAPSAAPEPAEVAPYRATHAAADGLSERVYRKELGRSALTLLALVIGSVLAFEGFSHVWGAWWLFWVYAALSFAAYWLVRGLRAREVEERDLVYRSFAEALRVQAAWATAGLDDWVGDHYAPQHHNELEWVRQAMKGLHALSACARGAPQAPDASRIRRAVDDWVNDQGAWFRRRRHALHGRVERFEGWAHAATRLAGGISGVFAILLLLVELRVLPDAWTGRDVRNGVLVAIVLSLAGAGLLHQWARWRSYAIAAKGYADAAQLFERAGAELEARLRAGTPADLSRAQQVLRVLGESALAENTKWLLSHRDHVLEIHGH